ncbi:MAG: hypothetical protein ACOC2Y_01975 [Spirochaetota bacterium]
MSDNAEIRELVHDLNNVMTRILTAAELLEGTLPADTEAATDARNIRSAALSGRDLITSISKQIGSR